ncbi:unnamed protein product [Leptosia nina]|uniref:Uncharacterized protein n=1 Tax=Leptosia nina TaxID=320188 RepID=A0AAV1JRQ5_9NEOP
MCMLMLVAALAEDNQRDQNHVNPNHNFNQNYPNPNHNMDFSNMNPNMDFGNMNPNLNMKPRGDNKHNQNATKMPDMNKGPDMQKMSDIPKLPEKQENGPSAKN